MKTYSDMAVFDVVIWKVFENAMIETLLNMYQLNTCYQNAHWS